jgi:hypothetical protein
MAIVSRVYLANNLNIDWEAAKKRAKEASEFMAESE